MHIVINSDYPFSMESLHVLPTQGDPLLNLLACLGYDSNNPPYGALLSKMHHLSNNCSVLSLGHWEASHNNAVLTAFGKDLLLNEDEAKQVFSLFASYIAEEGMQLHYHNPYTWLLECTDKPPITAKPIHHLLHKPLFGELSELGSSKFWQKFFTESQMFLASLSHNPLVNGFWCWGNSPLTLSKNITICADQSFAKTAQLVSEKFKPYNPSLKLSDCNIILIDNLEHLTPEHRTFLEKRKTNWYWNNIAYTNKPQNWLTRLWRS